MTYVIRRTDQGGGYVSAPGSRSSYTKSPLDARRFASLESALADLCPENEVVESFYDAIEKRRNAP